MNIQHHHHYDQTLIRALIIVSITGTIGSILQIGGANWDVVSHLLSIPDTFFTPSHLVLYSGVGLFLLSSLLILTLLIKFKGFHMTGLALPFKLVVVGSMLSVIAGPSDFLWHQNFGVDGFLSPTHLTIASGMLINSIGIVMGLFRISEVPLSRNQKHIIQIMLIPGIIALWLTSISFVYMLSLPISDGERFNFNLPSIAESVIALISLPLVNSVIFAVALRKFDRFGPASLIGSGVVIITSVTNILPSPQLSYFLPYYLLTIIPLLVADLMVNKKILGNKYKILSFNPSILIAGAISGSLFYIMGYPLLPLSLANNLFPINLSAINFETLIDVLPSFDGSFSFVFPLSLIIGALIGLMGSSIVTRDYPFYKVMIQKLLKINKSHH